MGYNKRIKWLIFLFIFILEFLLFKNIKYSTMGGGFIIKFYQIFLKENIYFLLIISSFFFTLIATLKEFNLKFYILIFTIFLILGLPKYLFQEWFDPIYLIFYYLLLPDEYIKNLKLDHNSSIIVLYIWEILILSTAIYYYHWYKKLPFFYSF